MLCGVVFFCNSIKWGSLKFEFWLETLGFLKWFQINLLWWGCGDYAFFLYDMVVYGDGDLKLMNWGCGGVEGEGIDLKVRYMGLTWFKVDWGNMGNLYNLLCLCILLVVSYVISLDKLFVYLISWFSCFCVFSSLEFCMVGIVLL